MAAARWMAEQGAKVTVTDRAAADELAGSLSELRGVELAAVHLGGHRESDFIDADVVIVNPAVKPDSTMLEIARCGGARLSSEIELFIEACSAKLIGVTGSNGKSTTAAMIAAVLSADAKTVWLGGNIGGSLLGNLTDIAEDDYVVLELSSFQLAHLGPNVEMPQAAVVTNFTPNHLNWHGSLGHYRASKQRLLNGQSPSGLAVLGSSLLGSDVWTGSVGGHLLSPADMEELPPLKIPGEHNRQNAALAASIARGLGCSQEAIRGGLENFEALSGRLQHVATIAGRDFYNDTTSTTPESTVAAVRALDNGQTGIWLLAGGSDKGVDFEEMAGAIVGHARGAAFFGATGEKLRRHAAEESKNFPAVAVRTLPEAFDWCLRHSGPGDAVVLSPGCASLDQFQNFRARGGAFVELVSALRQQV